LPGKLNNASRSAFARDADLSARIRAIYAGSRGTCGMPRVHAELAE